MDTKALKKQMGAAIAMVLVAAIALGSATFAWFVSNNVVKAETAGISAQSNAAFMVIKYNQKTDKNSPTEDKSTIEDKAQLLPAHIDDNGVWKSAFASSSTSSAVNSNTWYTITANGQADGTAAAAVASKYAIKDTFYIGSKTGTLENLKVAGVQATNNGSVLDSAVRVLVVCGKNWVVYDGAGKKVTVTGEAADEVLANTIEHKSDTDNGDQQVDVYVYYDGEDAKVYTDNQGMFTGDINVKVTFKATNKDLGGSGKVDQDQNA